MLKTEISVIKDLVKSITNEVPKTVRPFCFSASIDEDFNLSGLGKYLTDIRATKGKVITITSGTVEVNETFSTDSGVTGFVYIENNAENECFVTDILGTLSNDDVLVFENGAEGHITGIAVLPVTQYIRRNIFVGDIVLSSDATSEDNLKLTLFSFNNSIDSYKKSVVFQVDAGRRNIDQVRNAVISGYEYMPYQNGNLSGNVSVQLVGYLISY